MPASKKDWKYNHSEKGRLRSLLYEQSERGKIVRHLFKSKYNKTEKEKARKRRWFEEHPNYEYNWRVNASELIGCDYSQNWGLYKMLKNLPNAEIVEITV